MISIRQIQYTLNAGVDNQKGFTLVELLVVVIIIGILSAIAIPSFVNQIGKARGAEAKSGLGSINRSQQSYRFENNVFASQVTDLDIRINQKHYLYLVGSSTRNTAAHQTIPQNTDLKQYSSWVEQSGDVFTQFICESQETSIAASSTMTSNSCPINYSNID